MKALTINDEKSAIEYIQTVLTNWESWHTHHRGLVQALETLLKVNKSMREALILKCEYINELKEYVNELHQRMEEFEVAGYGT